jgi:hypothetical protein
MTASMLDALTGLSKHLREGAWNLRAPQEMADMAAAFIDEIVALVAKPPADDVLEALDLSPDQFRTDGGAINRGKLRAAIIGCALRTEPEPQGEAMTESAPLPSNSPLMVAWLAHKKTDDYANSLRWARVYENTEGSLWALFMAGFLAAEKIAAPVEQQVHADLPRITKLIDDLMIAAGAMACASLTGKPTQESPAMQRRLLLEAVGGLRVTNNEPSA